MENKPMCTRRGLDNDQMCRRKRLKCCHHKPMFKERTANIQFASLPEDVLCTIFSKLPLKEVVRTSVLSSEWKRMWKICPKLRFDGTTMCGGGVHGIEQHTQEFVDNVNKVLQQCHGKVVEELEIKFEYDRLLGDHLNSWVSMAVSSLTKNLSFDLAPAKWMGHCDGYRFPFELLDSKSLLRLQQIQLSFVSFELPPQFSGFPNLRKLELHLLRVTQKDLQDILSNCFSLEWLSMVRCHLDDELKVARPLSHLLYLRVEFCDITRIELSAMGLKTLIYAGSRCSIDVGYAPDLKDASLYLYEPITLEHALTALPDEFPSVQNLILHAPVPLEVPWLLEYPCKFSQLKYLRLQLLYGSQEAGNILSLSSFLSAAPVIETLELHFTVFALPHAYSMPIRSLPRCPHNYLKNLYITGFIGCTGQLEFLVHSVENAPVLEVLTIDPTIDPTLKFGKDTEYEMQTKMARVIASRCLDGRISPNTKLFIL